MLKPSSVVFMLDQYLEADEELAEGRFIPAS